MMHQVQQCWPLRRGGHRAANQCQRVSMNSWGWPPGGRRDGHRGARPIDQPRALQRTLADTALCRPRFVGLDW